MQKCQNCWLQARALLLNFHLSVGPGVLLEFQLISWSVPLGGMTDLKWGLWNKILPDPPLLPKLRSLQVLSPNLQEFSKLELSILLEWLSGGFWALLGDEVSTELLNIIGGTLASTGTLPGTEKPQPPISVPFLQAPFDARSILLKVSPFLALFCDLREFAAW